MRPARARLFIRLLRQLLRRSSKASPIAQSLTLLPPRTHCPAAPVPRPPQPIRPTRSRSLLFWAWTFESRVRFAAIAAAPVAVAVLRKSRRLAPFAGRCSLTVGPPGGGERG